MGSALCGRIRDAVAAHRARPAAAAAALLAEKCFYRPAPAERLAGRSEAQRWEALLRHIERTLGRPLWAGVFGSRRCDLNQPEPTCAGRGAGEDGTRTARPPRLGSTAVLPTTVDSVAAKRRSLGPWVCTFCVPSGGVCFRYNLHEPGSDHDRLVIYAAPFERLAGVALTDGSVAPEVKPHHRPINPDPEQPRP